MQRRILGPALAALVVAVAGTFAVPVAAVGTPVGAADAVTAAAVAACRSATGVTVIVDYNEIGGPTRAGCAPDAGGRSGAQAFADAGFSLEYDPRQPGYVCKVTGVPTDRPCLENDSFWSLWWSDGKTGRWVFSNQGVGGLDVPDGGYVAFAWHEGAGRADPPDVVPTAHEAPSPEPSDNGGNGGNNSGNNSGNDGGTGDDGGDRGNDAGAGSTTAAPSSSAATTATTSTTSTESASSKGRNKRDRESSDLTSATSSSTVPAAAEITAGPPTSDLATDTSDDGGGALMTWIGLGLAVLVLGAAGLVTVLRRRTG